MATLLTPDVTPIWGESCRSAGGWEAASERDRGEPGLRAKSGIRLAPEFAWGGSRAYLACCKDTAGRRSWGGGRGTSGGAQWHNVALLHWPQLRYTARPFGPVNPGMISTIHLGYRCNACSTRVPVYTFTRSSGHGARSCTPPVDRHVVCPTCHAPRHVAFAEIESLERWDVVGGADHCAA